MKKRIRVKRLFAAMIAALTTIMGWSAISLGDDSEARNIMAQVDAREDGDNQTADLEMILTDHTGGEKIQKLSFFKKDKGDEKMMLMFFVSPDDIKGTALLTYDYRDPKKEDDQWLFMPSSQRARRISPGNKSGSFMASDLTYSDLTNRDLADYDYRFYEKGREREFDAVKTWAIWAYPRSIKIVRQTGCEKSLLFVRQDNYVISRSISWMQNGGPLKYMSVNKLENIDGIWVAMEIQITEKVGKQITHQTLLKFSDVKFNENLDENLFSPHRLEEGFSGGIEENEEN